jgi:dihydrofolate reductase
LRQTGEEIDLSALRRRILRGASATMSFEADEFRCRRSLRGQGDDVVRKVVAYELLSLDGVAEAPDEFITDFDDAMRENLGRVIATQDTVLLGRRTYDDWARFWPTSDIEPFASFINGVEKFVVTSTLPGETWANTTVVDGGIVEFVAELRQRSGADIGVHGSIALTQSLFEQGMVDELRLVIAPALHMHGRKLFDKGLSRRLTLTRHVTSPSGYLLLDFQMGG